jgi:hypothetical protein
MVETENITYKNLCLILNFEFNYLEILIDDINFSNQETYIASVSAMLEYALTRHPKYIILNKLDSKFKIKPELYSFTRKNIIAPLKSDGLKKIICLVKKEEYEPRYKEIELIEPIIKALPSKAEALKWIVENP